MNQDDIDTAVAAIIAMRPKPPKTTAERNDTQVRRQLNDYFFEKELDAIEQEYKEDEHATPRAHTPLHRADDI
ncbi:hypothetical protein ACPV5U_27920 [Vibrio mediterranei]